MRDPSWQYALHEAYTQGWKFGSDVIFTYGPYGFLTTPTYHPATFSFMLAAWIALSGIFFIHVYRLATNATNHPLASLVISAIAVRIAALDAMTFLVSFLVLILVDSESQDVSASVRKRSLFQGSALHWRDWLTQAGLLLVVGLLPLTKYTFVPASIVVLAAISVQDILRRRFPLRTLMTVAATVLLWQLSGQPLTGFREYLVGGFEMAKHYEPAMSLWESQPFDVASVWCAAMLVVLIPFLLRPSRFRPHRFGDFITCLTLCLLLFLVWKFTFVRFHPQKIEVFYSTACLVALLSVLGSAARGDLIQRRHLSGLLIAFGLLLVSAVVVPFRYSDTPAWSLRHVLWQNPQNLKAAKAFVQGDGWMADRHQEACEEIQRQNNLTATTGSMDVFPDQLSLVLAREDVRFHPRPVMQGYSVYSPWLAKRNAAYYRSNRAPQNVLFRVDPLGDRFPTLCDGLVWRELLRNYRFKADLGQNYLLHRLPSSRLVQTTKFCPVAGEWNRWIELPNSTAGIIWCRVKLSQKLGGKLASLAYKLPPVFIEVRRKDATTRKFRYIPAAGETGFLLSPVVHAKEDFASLLNSDKAPNQPSVLAIRFLLTQEALREWFYEDSISIEFEQLLFSEAREE